SGTQVASPADWRISGVPQPPPTTQPMGPSGPTRKSGAPVGLIVGGFVGFAAIAGIAIYLATRPHEPQPPAPPAKTTTAPEPKTKDDGDKPPKDDVKKPKTKDWTMTATNLNPLRDVGGKFLLQEHEVTREEYGQYLAANTGAEKPLAGDVPTAS